MNHGEQLMSDASRWNDRYLKNDTPWETGQPSSQLRKILEEIALAPCRAVELGCGTGANAVWLAGQGFDVTAVDISALALERARNRAETAGTKVNFLLLDVLQPIQNLSGPFDFFFDRGCYHVVRRDNVAAYLEALRLLTQANSTGLVLTGNSRERRDPGPPVVSEEEIRAELGSLFHIVRLDEFRFDQVESDGTRFLGWSCLLRRSH